MERKYTSHGKGDFKTDQFISLGKNVIFEVGTLVFHPENIEINENVYVGHYAILKGYYKNTMQIGANTWIGQYSFLHSAGGLYIGNDVGIGPRVTVLTSQHSPIGSEEIVMNDSIDFGEVILNNGCDIGANSTILPGNTIGKGVIIAAGSVVICDIPDYEVWGGVPAKKIRYRMVS